MSLGKATECPGTGEAGGSGGKDETLLVVTGGAASGGTAGARSGKGSMAEPSEAGAGSPVVNVEQPTNGVEADSSSSFLKRLWIAEWPDRGA